MLKPTQSVSGLQGKKDTSVSIVRKHSSLPEQKDIIDVDDDIPALVLDLMNGCYSNVVTLKIRCSKEGLLKRILSSLCLVCLPSLTTIEVHSSCVVTSLSR